VPDRASRATCRKLFEEVYATELKDHSPAARWKLAETLLTEAGKAAEGSPDRFVLLTGAIQAAEGARSLVLCFHAVKALATGYDVDELAAKTDAVAKTFTGPVTAVLAGDENVEALLSLVDQLLAEDDFTTAAQVESALQRVAPSVSDADVNAQVKNQIREMGTLREARQKAVSAIEKLKKSPDDPAANLAAGSYFCFRRGQWEKGLPLLVKSGDPQLKNLAGADLAAPTDANAVTKLADEWFGVASKMAVADRPGAMQHAAELYRKAEAGLSGLEKLAVEKRLRQIPPSGRYRRVDLLEQFDSASSIVTGPWRMKDGVLVAEPAEQGRVEFAYEPPEEYDFRVSFTAVNYGGACPQILYNKGHQFLYQVGGWGNKVSAFEMVNGVGGPDNKTARRKPTWITSGQHYTSLVKVRKAGVEAYLDGQLVTSLKTDYSNMSLYGGWKVRHDNVVGLGAHLSTVLFETAEIIEITGEGKRMPP
jgi:hypothetical protein